MGDKGRIIFHVCHLYEDDYNNCNKRIWLLIRKEPRNKQLESQLLSFAMLECHDWMTLCPLADQWSFLINL